jgi:hypothetical protein
MPEIKCMARRGLDPAGAYHAYLGSERDRAEYHTGRLASGVPPGGCVTAGQVPGRGTSWKEVE